MAWYGHLGCKQRENGSVGYGKESAGQGIQEDITLSIFSAIEKTGTSPLNKGPIQTSKKEMAPGAQYIPPKAAKRYGPCHSIWRMILIPEEASSGTHGTDGDTIWLAVGPGACVTHHGHVPVKQVRCSLY